MALTATCQRRKGELVQGECAVDTTFIYVLLDPRTNEIRYVGKADCPDGRLSRHLKEKGRTHRHNWLANLRVVGLIPTMRVIEECPKTEWAEREAFWIAHYRALGCDLVNLCSGGNGAPGISPSVETRHKLSIALKRNHALHPRTFSAEARHKISVLHKGSKRPPETCQRISMAKMGKSPTKTEKMRLAAEAKKGKPAIHFTQEIKDKISVAMRGERNGRAKLSMALAREIRQRYAAGGISLSALGKEYGVDTRAISRIVRNEAYIEE